MVFREAYIVNTSYVVPVPTQKVLSEPNSLSFRGEVTDSSIYVTTVVGTFNKVTVEVLPMSHLGFRDTQHVKEV